MNKTAIFTYRCRQCGTLFESNTECSTECAMNHLIAAIHEIGYPTPNQPPIALLSWHTCEGDSKVGVADLAGYVVKEDN